MKPILIALLTIAAIHAQEPADFSPSGGEITNIKAKPDPALAYQTARAAALQAQLDVANRMIKDLKMQVYSNVAAINYCAADWGDPQKLQAAADLARKALDKLKKPEGSQ